MKKLIGAIFGIAMLSSAHAAQVAVSTPAAPGESSYLFGSDFEQVFQDVVNDETIGSAAYNARRDELGLVNAQDNEAGEELIYLGAHQSTNFGDAVSPNNNIAVNINNLNAGDGGAPNTGPVSLVLSASESLVWNLAIDDSVQINNIFLFSVNDQMLNINGQSVSLTGGNVQLFDGIHIETSTVEVCGYTLPTDGQGCNTDSILGINQQTFDIFDIESNTNPLGVDYLGQLTDLKVTSFNGSYLVDSFDIGINSAAVPLPGALICFVSALGLIVSRRHLR